MTTGRINQVAFLTDAGAARDRQPTPGGDAATAPRGDVGSRSVYGRWTPLRSGKRRPRASCPPGVPHPRAQAAARGPRLAPWPCGSGHEPAFVVHPTPHPRRGQRWENVVRWDSRIPFRRYAIQETRGRPRPVTVLLRQQLKGHAREDVAAPAGIRPAQTSPSLPTRHHDRHVPNGQAAHSNPQGSPVPTWKPESCNVRRGVYSLETDYKRSHVWCGVVSCRVCTPS